MIAEDQFQEWLTHGYNWLPLIVELSGETSPQNLYQHIANTPYSYLLESGVSGEKSGRYSIIGLSARTRIIVSDFQVTYIQDGCLEEQFISKDPLKEIERIIANYHVPPLPHLDFFIGGFVGYFGYDTIRYIEPKLAHHSLTDTLKVPDIFLLLSEEIIVYDSLAKKLYLIVYVPGNKNAYYEAIARIKQLTLELLKEREQTVVQQLEETKVSSNEIKTQFDSNFSVEDYEKNVLKAKEYFLAGDAMQLILSQRFSRPYKTNPLTFYSILRLLNPSPYMYYFDMEDFFIAGASPEILVKLEDNKVTVRPLAGTRPRGKTAAQDAALERELLKDVKEIAEHLMLIDLGRNDIGRICKIGSVHMEKQMVIERFSHVMHISSTVVGEVQPNTSDIDILRATFPAGTVSGAPKIRAMEIIDELETDKRGIYGGAIGYLGWHGRLDLAIALRTAVFKDDTVYVQAGAGLVADSIPKNEWQECINKAKALFLAADIAENNDSSR
jgi:anthranilate synthase component 1